jgi:putative colanic acid biosynthesis acetyltransferase WcaF
MTVDRQLGRFDGSGYVKGRNLAWQVAWFIVMNTAFSKWWCPPALRPLLLRVFGAKVGSHVVIRHRVRVHWPWKLEIGDNCWVGEDAWLLNLEPIRIGHDVCISQAALLCTGSHNRHQVAFGYDNAPIEVSDHAWIGARATILRGVSVGKCAVVGACTLVARSVPDGVVTLGGRPANRVSLP